MEEIINLLRAVWNAPYVHELVLVIVTAVVTHFFESLKQRKEQKIKFRSTIGEQIATALSSVRKLVVNINTIEVFAAAETIPQNDANNISAFQDFSYYPSFMTNHKTFGQLCDEISLLRKNSEQFLDLKSAAYLYGIEKYLISLMLFIGHNNLQDHLPFIGCFVIADVQNWEKKFDKHLVKKINKPHYKLFSRHGIKWRITKWYIKKSFLNKSELHKMMQGKSDFYKSMFAGIETKKDKQYIHG